MREINLSGGFVALVDDEDYEYLNQFNWCVQRLKHTYYAARRDSVLNSNDYLYMHRVIMNTPSDMQVDHRDHNGLNNQKYNLKNCTKMQNAHNMKPRSRSGYLGVSISKKGYIIAQITCGGHYEYIGIYKTTKDAAEAYDKRAKELFGEFANLNFKYED